MLFDSTWFVAIVEPTQDLKVWNEHLRPTAAEKDEQWAAETNSGIFTSGNIPFFNLDIAQYSATQRYPSTCAILIRVKSKTIVKIYV